MVSVGQSGEQSLKRIETAGERASIRRAIELVRGSDLPLAQIAFRTGFSSQAHMTRRVRAHAGRPPGAIRRAG